MRKPKSQCEKSAENVKDLRQGRGLTQEEFAEKIGVAPNTISRIEQNENPMSANVALKIAQEFHVSLDYLFGRTPYEEGEPPCSKTCEELINAQNLIEIQENMIKELEGKIQAVKEAIEGKRTIRLKKTDRSN